MASSCTRVSRGLRSASSTGQPVNRKQIRAFAELDFVAKHENLVYVGKTGVAKPDSLVGSY